MPTVGNDGSTVGSAPEPLPMSSASVVLAALGAGTASAVRSR